jgi:ATP-dependent DNA helicase RecQ
MLLYKRKHAKKWRKDIEYGSARWGNRQDIEPYIDSNPDNNVILTATESLMLNGRPKNPKYARNKNVLIVDCVLFYSGQDVRTNLWLIENDRNAEYPDKETEEQIKDRARKRLREMTFYCATTDCLRGYILKYFGENPQVSCGNCENCSADFETVDITLEAQHIVRCITLMKEDFGIKMVMDVLTGSENEKIFRYNLDKLSTFGSIKKSEKQLREIISSMIVSGYLANFNGKYPLLKLGRRADEVWNGNVYMKLRKEQETDDFSHKSKKPAAIRPVDKRLLESLKKLRTFIANEYDVPSYVIFSDSTLTDMCMKMPRNHEELLNVSGVGNVKAEKYGERFLKAIAAFQEAGNITAENEEPQNPQVKEPDLSSAEISEEAVSVSVIADRINCVFIESGYAKITGQKINDWLVSEGYIKVTEENGKNFKIPTEAGLKLGITNEPHIIRGENARINLFNPEAQKYIISNALQIK